MSDEHEDDYRGPATIRAEDRELAAEVVLRGFFQPIDGKFHWYGRAAADAAIDELAGGRKTAVVLRTPDGEAPATLSEPDPWGRYRITGTGKPPFAVES
ncbi:DUF4873 domain-containing protein [Saccharopolyspora griseoalba]|uniref:DUF4873 domain-containing protein n=1 Tax=Saccharopolyspora griseoalba TaxID=1431848 RepID=A0ABW2LNS0_9PSEU